MFPPFSPKKGCKIHNFSSNRRYAPKDSKKGGLVAKGAAPSRELVRTGIENVLKEVLGAIETKRCEIFPKVVELKQLLLKV